MPKPASPKTSAESPNGGRVEERAFDLPCEVVVAPVADDAGGKDVQRVA